MPYGTLVLTVVDGRNLKDQDLFGKMDPYVNFQLAAGTSIRNKWRCKTHKNGGKNPSWNDRHNFDVVEGDDRIQAQVYDEDTASDDLIGSASIDLGQVFSRGIRDEWFPLQVHFCFPACGIIYMLTL
jgi:Ca2+-dependent lipid-binding protein